MGWASSSASEAVKARLTQGACSVVHLPRLTFTVRSNAPELLVSNSSLGSTAWWRPAHTLPATGQRLSLSCQPASSGPATLKPVHRAPPGAQPQALSSGCDGSCMPAAPTHPASLASQGAGHSGGSVSTQTHLCGSGGGGGGGISNSSTAVPQVNHPSTGSGSGSNASTKLNLHSTTSAARSSGGSSGSSGDSATAIRAQTQTPPPSSLQEQAHSQSPCTLHAPTAATLAASGMAAPDAAAPSAPSFQHTQPHREQDNEADLLDVFGKMDTDQSGLVGAGELQAALTRLGLPTSQEYLDDVLHHFDLSHNRSIDFSRFNTHVRRMETNLGRAFRSYDTNGDGTIDGPELGAALARVGLPPSERQVRCMLALLDTDHDGGVSYREFRRFACMLPRTQLVSPSHIYFAWANSALWLDSSARAPAGDSNSTGGACAAAGRGGSTCGADVHTISSPNETAQKLLVGGLAGVVARTLIAPIERLRTMAMLSRERVGVGESVSRMWRDGGFRGLFRGHLSTVLKVFPCSAIQFAVFDATKRALLHRKGPEGGPLTELDRFLAGCTAGGCACLISHPLDTIRTHMAVASAGGLGMGGWRPGCVQVQGSPGHPMMYRGALDAFARISREEGLGAFYKGMLATYCKTAPSMGALYFFFDLFSRMLGVGGLNRYRAIA
ncbi:MAG: hypothetical protein WDW38_003344 [Sanguina aurantia]